MDYRLEGSRGSYSDAVASENSIRLTVDGMVVAGSSPSGVGDLPAEPDLGSKKEDTNSLVEQVMSACASNAPEELECVICFAEITACTALPCSCNIAYCERCWDRALAQSFTTCGQARCPTCRRPVHVDFDAQTCKLAFSMEADNFTFRHEVSAHTASSVGSEQAAEHFQRRRRIAESRQRAITRLAEQAQPAQVKILQAYGARHTFMRRIVDDPQKELGAEPCDSIKEHIMVLGGVLLCLDDCVEKSDLIARLVDVAGSRQVLASYWASRKEELPACVCGRTLRRCSGGQRTEKYLQNARPDLGPGSPAYAAILARISRNGGCGIVCDTCEGPVKAALWSCECGGETILHAAAYDVCDECFIKYTLGTGEENAGTDAEAAATARPPEVGECC